MSSARERRGEDELRESEAWYERAAMWGGAAVIFGLVVEVALTSAFPKGRSIIEEWGPVAADALIALGVTCEVIFAAKARSRTELLKVISDQKVAEANKIAAQATKDAADARERTAEIEKLTAWRKISPEQHSSIKTAIRGEAAKIDLLVEYERGDAEAFAYAQQIAWIFQQAGVTLIRGDANSYLTPGIFGVRIASAPEIDILSIVNAFASAGVELTGENMDLSRHLPRNVQAPNLYLFVSPKPPPSFGPMQPARESSI